MIAKNQIVQQTEYPHIVKITGVCGGQAIIEGTRIAVWHLVGYYYKVGLPVEEILAEWDYLTPAQVFSALAYYHDHRQEIDEVRQKIAPNIGSGGESRAIGHLYPQSPRTNRPV